MWQRAELKFLAKQELKSSYWLSFGVCLVAGILAGCMGGTGGASGARSANLDFNAYIISAMIAAALISSLIAIAVSIFLYYPVEVGKKRFFIRAPYGDRRFSHLFSSFQSGRYMPTVKTMFVTNLIIFLWSLLLVIPGIIKMYQYRMVPYLISEDPSLSPQQAMDLSSRMTDGEKWEMFVLDLSFIGWFILGSFVFGIGILFVSPYYEATWAQLYFALKPKVITPTNGGYAQPQF